MIQVEDLRIGNLIQYAGRFWKVVSISSFPTIGVDRGNEEVTLSEALTEPVPLSKEVLLACGFKFSGSLWDIETKENGLFFIEFAGNCVTITAKGKDWGHCTSLHQLQNLFYSLTKTELNYHHDPTK